MLLRRRVRLRRPVATVEKNERDSSQYPRQPLLYKRSLLLHRPKHQRHHRPGNVRDTPPRPYPFNALHDITVISTVRLEFDPAKSRAVEKKHGVSLKDASEVFDQVYIVDQRNDDPFQYRAIGWCCGRLCSVIFEIRSGELGEYHHLVTAWKATPEEEQSYAENV